jgi:predicted transcriptional regulator
MEFKLDSYQSRVLSQMYESYKKWLQVNKRYKKNSVLFSILKMTKNTRHEFLRVTAEKYIDLPTASFLIDEGLIRETDEKGSYSFTGKGLEYTETEIIGNNEYFSALDEDYFNVFDNISIGDRERIILLTMVALRTFSDKATVDMRDSTGIKDAWWEVMLLVNDLMVENNIIPASSSLRNATNESKIEHPASHLIRHSDVLPRATKGIFSKTGKNQYYISISQEGVLNIDKLADVLELIFENNHHYLTLSTISSEMRSFCRLHGLDVASSLQEDYFDSKYDDFISGTFELTERRFEYNQPN